MTGWISDGIERIERYAISALLIATFLTGCGQEVMPPERTDNGRDTVETQSTEPDNTVDEMDRQETVEEDAAAPSEVEDGHWAEDEGNNLVMAVSPQGERITEVFYSEDCYCYLSGDLYGYLAEDGSEIAPCIYSHAMPFSEGLACVCLDGKYGYIGKDGETVLPFIYDQASPFVEGTAYFSCGEEYGLIDREGNVVLRLEGCDSISSFREGLAYFSEDGRYGYMDQTGRIVIPPIYDDAGHFQEGLAVVRKGGLCGVIGSDGREILLPQYDSISLEEACIIAQKEGLYYLFDRESGELLAGAWDNIYEDYRVEGLFQIWNDKKCGLADGRGQILLEPVYEYLTLIPGRELVIVRAESGAYGVLDYEGQVKVPFIYENIYYAVDADGLQVTDRDTAKTGFLDGTDFSVRIPVIYDSLEYLTETGAVAGLDGKHGVIRYDGTLETPLEYDKIALFSDGSRAVWTGENMVLTDRQGNTVLSGQYDTIWERGSGYETKQDGKSSYWDRQGNPVFSGQYDTIQELGNGFETMQGSKKSYWDRQGNLIVSGYDWRDTVYGAENVYILGTYAEGANVILRTGEENGQYMGRDLEKVLSTNWITPRAGAFVEFLKNGTIALEDAGPGHTEELGTKVWYEHRFSKLYRVGEEQVLYFYAEPWEQSIFPESYSGLFILRDGQVEQLISGYECGGSLMGDYVCFSYDREEDTWKPGTWGNWGGFGGHSGGGHVYTLQEGRAVEENSFLCCDQTARNYDEEELLENAELFYDGGDRPFTRETILEAGYVTEYSVCGVQVSVEEYQAVSGRYRFYMPLMW